MAAQLPRPPRRLQFPDDDLRPAFQRRFSPAPPTPTSIRVSLTAREVLNSGNAPAHISLVVREVLVSSLATAVVSVVVREVLLDSPVASNALPAPPRRLVFPDEALSPAFRRAFAPLFTPTVVGVIGAPPRRLIHFDDDASPAFQRRFMPIITAAPIPTPPRRLRFMGDDDVSPTFRRVAAPVVRRPRPQVLVFS